MPVPRPAEKTPPASTDEFVSSIHLHPAPHPLVKVGIPAVSACSLKRTNVKWAWSDLLSAHRPEEQDADRYDVGEPEPDVDGARGIGAAHQHHSNDDDHYEQPPSSHLDQRVARDRERLRHQLCGRCVWISAKNAGRPASRDWAVASRSAMNPPRGFVPRAPPPSWVLLRGSGRGP